jgi:uncharacterized protein (TIGR03437 family)
MGDWLDAKQQPVRPVREALAGDCVAITRASSSFLFPYDQTIHDLSAVSAANFRTPLAPEAIASVFGQQLATTPAASETSALSARLNGATLKVRDSACVERLAPLFFVSPAQINFLVPAGTASGTATLVAYNNAGSVSLGTVNIGAVAPGIFTANANGRGVPAAVALRLKSDGTQSYEAVSQYDEGQKQFVTRALEVSQSGEQVFLLLFGTGWRNRSSLGNVSATLGGINLEVLFAGSQGTLAGLDQVNLRLPNELSGRGELDLVLKVDGQTANPVRLQIR